MSIATQIYLLTLRKLKETLRQPAWTISSLATPLLYLALFAPLLKGALDSDNIFAAFVPGMLVLMAFGAGMGAGWNTVWELEGGVTERMRVTPASRMALMLGPVLRDVIVFLATALIVVLISAPLGFLPHAGGMAITLLLLALLTATVSVWSSTLGLILRDISALASVVTSLQLPLTLLSGILLPLELGPGWLRALAHIDPLYYAAEAARALCRGDVLCPASAAGMIVLPLLTALTLLWGLRVFRRAVS